MKSGEIKITINYLYPVLRCLRNLIIYNKSLYGVESLPKVILGSEWLFIPV